MTRKRLRFLAPLLAATLVAAGAACDSGGGDSPGAPGGDDDGQFPRHETLYTTGKQWGDYANFNPFTGDGWATGIAGLVYETLFIFNPWTAELEPWLAESGEWTADDEYTITLREGIEWQDGEAFTAEDVKFTLDLREYDSIPYSNLRDWIDEVTVENDTTVIVSFSDPRRGEWDNILHSRWIGPQHLYEDVPGDDIVNEPGDGDRLSGTGPYKYHSHDPATVLRLERDDEWWGVDALGLEMAPRYIIDWSNASHNDIARQELVSGNIDLSNNFLPVETLDDPNVEAFRDEPPYMIAWNTAMLIPNTTKEPMDDAEFRRAMAHSINVQEILDTAYAGLVSAADPTGLLPTWVDQGMVDEGVVNEHGFSYNPDEANRILDEAGYTLDGDYRTTPGGDPIELTLVVPQGWTDWNLAAEIIADGLQQVGLNVVADFPDSDTVDNMRTTGDFDLLVNNWTELSNTPWALWNYVFRLPIQENQSPSNFERYENPEAWALVQELGGLSVSERDQTNFDEVHSEIQEIFLSEMPVIPMWYNGLWSQWNTTYWTNWPTAGATPEQNGPLPSTWNNAWNKSGVLTLAEIEPTGEGQ